MAKNQKKQPNKLFLFSGLAIEMGITIYICAKIGNWLDDKYPNSNNYFTLSLVVFGFVATMFLLIKKLQKIQN